MWQHAENRILKHQTVTWLSWPITCIRLINTMFSRHQCSVVCRWRLVSVGRRSPSSTMTWPIRAAEGSSMEVVTLMLTTLKQRKSVRTPAQASQVTHTHTHTGKLSFYFEALHKAKLIRILLMDFCQWWNASWEIELWHDNWCVSKHKLLYTLPQITVPV